MLEQEASSLSEREGLSEFLDMQREALIERLQSLSDSEARGTPTASALSLLSIVKHSAIWERRWFQVIVAGRSFEGEWPNTNDDEIDQTFQLTNEDSIQSVVNFYREQIVASQEILKNMELDAACAWPKLSHRNLRWVALHMIEETARHAGHADIIRESLDGSRGR